jgi:hypothetical protein
MVKVRRIWGGIQWVGPEPIDWTNPPPPDDPGWQYCYSYWVGLLHPAGQWGVPLTIGEHELIVMEDAATGHMVTDCGMPIGLRSDVYSLADVEAWASLAAARYEAWAARLLSVCPGCRLGGHRFCPM